MRAIKMDVNGAFWRYTGIVLIFLSKLGAAAAASVNLPPQDSASCDVGSGMIIGEPVSGSGFAQRQLPISSLPGYYEIYITPEITSAVNPDAFFGIGRSDSSIAVTPSYDGLYGNEEHRGPYAIVPNFGDDTVTIYDIKHNNQMVGTINVGDGPYGVAAETAGRFVYVTNKNSGNVSIIDVQKFAVVGTIAVGASPAGVALDVTGDRLYVANEGDNTLSVIDIASRAVIKTINTERQPRQVLMAPGHDFVYVLNLADATVSAVNVQTLSLTTFPVTLNMDTDHVFPRHVALGGVGKLLYVTLTNATNSSMVLVVVDTSSLSATLVLQLNGNPNAVALSPDNAAAYLAVSVSGLACGELIKVHLDDTSKGLQIRHVEPGIHSLLVSDDNAQLYAINSSTNAIHVYDAYMSNTTLRTPLVGWASHEVIGDFVGLDLPPALTLQPGEIDFGTVSSGQQVQRILTLVNNGLEQMVLHPVEIVPSIKYTVNCPVADGAICPPLSDPEIAIVGNDCLGDQLMPGESCSITLVYSSASIDVNRMDLRIVAETPQGMIERRVELIASVSALSVTENNNPTSTLNESQAVEGGGGMFGYAELLLMVFGIGAPRVIILASARFRPRRGRGL